MEERRWVFLADPSDYGWNELVRDARTVWDGIKGAQAQRNLAQCGAGDPVLIYHTSPDKALVGTARVSGGPRPDPKFPERVVVDLEPVLQLRRPLGIAELRDDGVLSQAGFVKIQRVAVQPISLAHWDRVMEKTGTDPGAALATDAAEAGGP
ncbi:MAG: EVE domain-containing protein [Gemmatimonadetes bacterium]|nr:EVE domain-containing protein [Gemmatimonadota bacterium]